MESLIIKVLQPIDNIDSLTFCHQKYVVQSLGGGVDFFSRKPGVEILVTASPSSIRRPHLPLRGKCLTICGSLPYRDRLPQVEALVY